MEVLELMRSASERFESVRAALRYSADGPMHKEIRERIERTDAGRCTYRISPREASAEAIERPELCEVGDGAAAEEALHRKVDVVLSSAGLEKRKGWCRYLVGIMKARRSDRWPER